MQHQASRRIVFAEVEAIVDAVPEFAQFQHQGHVVLEARWRCGAGPGKGTVYDVLPGEKEAAHGLAPTLWVYDELGHRAITGNCSTRCRRHRGKRDRSPRHRDLDASCETTAHTFSLLIDDALKSEDPAIVVQAHCGRRRRGPVRRGGDPRGSIRRSVSFSTRATYWRTPRRRSDRRRTSRSFRNLRLNQRVDARSEKRLLTPAQWALGNAPVDEAALAGKECVGGLDLSRKIDLTALELSFEDEDGVKHLVGRYWTPLEALDGRSQAERELFQTVAQGRRP